MSEDFGFYGEEADELQKQEIRGITGNVTDFTFTNIDYPCIIFNEDFKCPKHKLNVISNMVKSPMPTKDISIYFIKDGDLYKIGMIDGVQVNAFLDVIGIDMVKGFFNAETKLTGSMLYTLCTVA